MVLANFIIGSVWENFYYFSLLICFGDFVRVASAFDVSFNFKGTFRF